MAQPLKRITAMNSLPHCNPNGQMTEKDLADEIVRIYQRAQAETLELIQYRPGQTTELPARDWMSATQLAAYWQLCNDKHEPTTAGILKWTRRPPDQFPLPHAYMGDLLRFNREEVDRWAKEEAERRRVQNEKRRLKIA